MFADTTTIKTGFEHHEWYSVACQMDLLASDYLEGDNESSRDEFNQWFHRLPMTGLKILQQTSVFGVIRNLCGKAINHEIVRAN